MSSILPINVDDLLRGRSIESARVEFKAGWNPETTGVQVLKTICAFANDLQSLNGGYIVIGVAESEGRAVRPVAGLSGAEIDAAQGWIRGRCNTMRPGYAPILSPEVLDGRDVLVVWAHASDDSPHRAPDDRGRWKYWVRIGSETVDAEANGRLDALLEQKARVPWDHRAAHGARIEDLREAKVREHLHDVRSALRDEPDAVTIYRRMLITTPVNEHEVPRNIGLLFFSDDPEQWFPGARIAVVQFAADRAGEVQSERVFRGTLAAQIRDCLRYLEGLSQTHLKKERDRSQVRGWVSYPVPVAGIEPHHFEAGASDPPAPVPARNHRVGEFLKQLGLAEGWRTGLPRIYRAMEENGSPAPRFEVLHAHEEGAGSGLPVIVADRVAVAGGEVRGNGAEAHGHVRFEGTGIGQGGEGQGDDGAYVQIVGAIPVRRAAHGAAPRTVSVVFAVTIADQSAASAGNTDDSRGLPSHKCWRAHAASSTLRNPLTTVSFMRCGWPRSLVSTAATKGVFPGAPRPAFPPLRWPPR